MDFSAFDPTGVLGTDSMMSEGPRVDDECIAGLLSQPNIAPFGSDGVSFGSELLEPMELGGAMIIERPDLMRSTRKPIHEEQMLVISPRSAPVNMLDLSSLQAPAPISTAGRLSSKQMALKPATLIQEEPMMSHQSSDKEGGTEGGDDGGEGGVQGQGSRRRTSRQQELNRQAQARYREKRKIKFSSLQHTVEDLENKLETIERLKNEAEELKKINDASNVKLCRNEFQIQLQSKVIIDQSKALREAQAKIDVLLSHAPSSTTSTSEGEEGVEGQIMKALKSALDQLTLRPAQPLKSTMINEAKDQISLRFQKMLREESVAGFLAILSQPSASSSGAYASGSVGDANGYILLNRAVARRSCGDMMIDGGEKGRVSLGVAA